MEEEGGKSQHDINMTAEKQGDGPMGVYRKNPCTYQNSRGPYLNLVSMPNREGSELVKL